MIQSSRHLDRAMTCSGVPTPTGQPVMQRMASLVLWMLPQRRSWHCATQQKSPMLPVFCQRWCMGIWYGGRMVHLATQVSLSGILG